MKLFTTKEAAKILEVSQRRVQALVTAARLPAVKMGGVYLIKEKDLRLIAVRKPGRPPVKKK
jgi:excisionase family DNA binding protein